MKYVERFHRSAPQWYSLPGNWPRPPEARSGKNIERRHRLGLPAQPRRRRGRRLDALSMQLPSPWVMDSTALAVHRRRGREPAAEAVPGLGEPAAVAELNRRRQAVCGAAGSGAHGRARRRPGLLDAASGGLSSGAPARPVRRGRGRLLRHLRGLAAKLGERALQGADDGQHAEHPDAVAVGRGRGDGPASWTPLMLSDDEAQPSAGAVHLGGAGRPAVGRHGRAAGAPGPSRSAIPASSAFHARC